jgi:hypothetical protein
MDTKRKICDIRSWRKLISRHILHQHWYTCPIALPVRRNPQYSYRSLLITDSATSAPPFQSILYRGNVCHQGWNAVRDKNFPPYTGNISLRISFAFSSFAPPPKKAQKHTALRRYTPQTRSPFWLLNQPVNLRMRICYLDCHEAGLCCYLVIHIENLLHPLQLFCFHLWSIYLLFLVSVLGCETCLARRQHWHKKANVSI